MRHPYACLGPAQRSAPLSARCGPRRRGPSGWDGRGSTRGPAQVTCAPYDLCQAYIPSRRVPDVGRTVLPGLRCCRPVVRSRVVQTARLRARQFAARRRRGGRRVPGWPGTRCPAPRRAVVAARERRTHVCAARTGRGATGRGAAAAAEAQRSAGRATVSCARRREPDVRGGSARPAHGVPGPAGCAHGRHTAGAGRPHRTRCHGRSGTGAALCAQHVRRRGGFACRRFRAAPGDRADRDHDRGRRAQPGRRRAGVERGWCTGEGDGRRRRAGKSGAVARSRLARSHGVVVRALGLRRAGVPDGVGALVRSGVRVFRVLVLGRARRLPAGHRARGRTGGAAHQAARHAFGLRRAAAGAGGQCRARGAGVPRAATAHARHGHGGRHRLARPAHRRDRHRRAHDRAAVCAAGRLVPCQRALAAEPRWRSRRGLRLRRQHGRDHRRFVGRRLRAGAALWSAGHAPAGGRHRRRGRAGRTVAGMAAW